MRHRHWELGVQKQGGHSRWEKGRQGHAGHSGGREEAGDGQEWAWRGQRLEGAFPSSHLETMSPCTEAHLQPHARPLLLPAVHPHVLQMCR